MGLSNYPPGTSATDPAAPWNQDDEDYCEECEWPSEECNCAPAHDEFCGVNRVIRRSCDCDHDS